MILSIFFRVIIVRTLCAFHSNENAATLSLSHSFRSFLANQFYLPARRTQAG